MTYSRCSKYVRMIATSAASTHFLPVGRQVVVLVCDNALDGFHVAAADGWQG